jgi:hypothetical protein
VRGRRKFPSFSKGETIYQPTYFYQPSYSVFTNTLFNVFLSTLFFMSSVSYSLFLGRPFVSRPSPVQNTTKHASSRIDGDPTRAVSPIYSSGRLRSGRGG